MDQTLARQRLAELNAAPSLNALSPLRSVGLHKLKGDRAGSWAIKINGPWRIVFRFKDGNAHDVEIVDYH
jgi:toxin HigB-1